MRQIEKIMDMREKKEKRKNIVIKKRKKENIRDEVKDLIRDGDGCKNEGIKLGSKEEKREIMKRKSILKERVERIEDDWTCNKRRIQFNLRRIAEEKEREGTRTQATYRHIWLEGKWRS
ncbi:PREDICTED: uncharacterized protein LOC108754778 [Trachymyrmex septentrionalis]|uniref:uncharacterized protein LOC108754778 n=1 Tax=Trachymyrmex septentrionalis TaxID=34720 RepID=UPI00084EF19A|nr:PREDICTED: uncharacterized protein LOC108754778 [Trachymyrmex septentrionalis]